MAAWRKKYNRCCCTLLNMELDLQSFFRLHEHSCTHWLRPATPRPPPGIWANTLQRQNTEISKQIFPEKEYRGLSPNFHIHASLSDLYIPTIGLPILIEEICRPILGLYKSLTDT
jgi:hypothetical protein